MKIINRFKVLSSFLITAYLLAAWGGTLPQLQLRRRDQKWMQVSSLSPELSKP
jgi:hypothetical protein